MTYLEEEGVLADNLEAFATLVQEKYAPWLSEARAHNRIANQMQYAFKVRPESAQDLFCCALFVRVLEYTQTALLLIERGLRAPARVMLRCAVEALFNLTACSANYETAVSFMDADLIARKKTGEYLQQVSGEHLKAQVVGKDVTKRLRNLPMKLIHWTPRLCRKPLPATLACILPSGSPRRKTPSLPATLSIGFGATSSGVDW